MKKPLNFLAAGAMVFIFVLPGAALGKRVSEPVAAAELRPQKEFQGHAHQGQAWKEKWSKLPDHKLKTWKDVQWQAPPNHKLQDWQNNEEWTASNHGSSSTPLPGAVWLIGSGLAGLAGLKKKVDGKIRPHS